MKKLLFLVFFLMLGFHSFCQILDDVKNNYLGKTVHFKPGNEFKGVKILIGLSKNIKFEDGVYPHYESTREIPYQFEAPFTYSDSLTNKNWLCVGVEEGDPGYSYLKLQEFNNINNVIYYHLYYQGADIYTDEGIQKQQKDENLEKSEKLKKDQQQNNEINDPCSQIEYTYDNFHYTKHYNTSMELPEKIADTSYEKYFNAIFYKDILKGQPTYYVSLNTTSSIPEALQRGVIIILKNGKRIRKPLAKVETTVEEVHDEATYVIKSFITLDSNDILLLKSSPLSEFELYINQDAVIHPDIVYRMFLCLLSKK